MCLGMLGHVQGALLSHIAWMLFLAFGNQLQQRAGTAYTCSMLRHTMSSQCLETA